jgi:WXG100 family type VII secretion target
MTQITLDSEQVLGIASQIENDNNELRRLLDDSKATIDALSSYWQGGAADETRNSYDAFSKSYFQTYQDVLTQYVKFLRSNVAEQYSETETFNTKLAEAFK